MNKNRKTSHILNVFQFDANGHVILPATLTIGENPHSSDNTSKIPSTSWIRTYVTGLSYLTGNQSITVSGDATGSGTTAITLTLANTAVTPGTYGSTTLVPVVTVDSKGRITSVTTAAISGSLTFTGDVTGTGTTGTSTGLTLAASGVTAGTYTKVTVDSKGRVTVGASASTTDISEGTNLYYTDTRVGTYLTANSYATQSYVGTQIANLVASAPATLDTLNELSVALGNDPNFATSVATSIGTKQAQLNGTGFVKVIGTTVSYDNNTYLTSFTETDPTVPSHVKSITTTEKANWNTAYGWGNHAIVGYLTSVPTHNQAWSTITSTPTTISGYGITNAYTDAQIQNFFNGANAITGYNKSNWDTAYGWGNHASGGYLTGITSSQVTTALGYTPYNSTNPSGYITGITSSNVTTALGYTPYNSTNPSGYITGITSGNVTTALGYTPYNSTNPSGYITGINSSAVTTALGFTPLSSSGNVTIGGYLTVTGAGTSSSIYMSDTDEGQREIHCNSNRIGFLTQAGAWGAYCDDSGNWAAANFSGSSSGTNTGDQTNISGNSATTSQRNFDGSLTSPDFYASGWFRTSGATAGLYNSTHNTHFYASGTGQWNFATSNNSWIQIALRPASHESTVRGYIYADTSNNVGLLTYDGNWALRVDTNKNVQIYGSVSATNLSGTNTGDQTNISGNAATATAAAGVSFLTQPNATWAGRLQLGGNGGGGAATVAVVQATNGNLHMDAGSGNHIYLNYYNNGVIYLNGSTYNISANGSQYNGNSATATTASNASTADGLAVHGGTNNEVNKIVRTDANGYIQAGWINSISGNMGFENRIARITCSTDQYMRFQTLTEFKVSLGMSGKNDYSRRIDYTTDANYHVGSFGHGGAEVGNIDRIFHYGSGFFDVWSGNGTYAPGTSHIHGFNALHYTVGYGGNAYGWQMASQYNQTGLIYARWCNAGTFSAWQTIITSANIGSQSVSYASTAGSAGSVTGSSTISGYLTLSTNWGVSPYTAAFNIVGTHPSMVFRGSNGDTHYLIHMDSAGDIQYYFGPGYLTNNWVQRYTFSKGGDFTLRSGSLVASGDITAFSDARVKTNIQTIENALNKTLTLRGVTYTRTDSDDKKTKIGVIAQETLPIVPEVVNQDSAGMYNVSYGNITALLIEAIKEQQLQIEELKNKLDGLTS